MKHLKSIDGLKGIGIVAIIMTHWGSYLNQNNSIIKTIITNSSVAVEMFLIITVFLSCMSYERMKMQSTMMPLKNCSNERKMYLCWLKKKLFRLLPCYYIALLIAIIIGGTEAAIFYQGTQGVTLINIVSHFLLLFGFNPYWVNSILGVEWYLFAILIVYLFTPIMTHFINTIYRAVTTLFMSIPVMIFINILLKALNPIDNTDIWYNFIGGLNILYHLPAVFCGCLIFNIVKRGISEKIDAKSKKILGNTILFGTLTLIILVMFSNMKYSIILWDIFWGIILFSQFIHENNIIANPFFTAIGKLSYEIYLFHILLIESIKKIPVFSSNDLLDWGGEVHTVGCYFSVSAK